MNICSYCGNRIPAWSQGVCPGCARIENDRKRFGHSGTKRPLRRRSNRRSSQHRRLIPSIPKHKLGGGVISKARARRQEGKLTTARYLSVQLRRRSPLAKRVIIFNRFLSEIYGVRCHISDVLRRGGVTQGDIERLKRRYLRMYLDLLARNLNSWVEKELRITKHPRDRLIRRLRLDQNRARFETIVLETATMVLKTDSGDS